MLIYLFHEGTYTDAVVLETSPGIALDFLLVLTYMTGELKCRRRLETEGTYSWVFRSWLSSLGGRLELSMSRKNLEADACPSFSENRAQEV